MIRALEREQALRKAVIALNKYAESEYARHIKEMFLYGHTFIGSDCISVPVESFYGESIADLMN